MSEQSGLLSQTKFPAMHSPLLHLNSSVEQGTRGPWLSNNNSDRSVRPNWSSKTRQPLKRLLKCSLIKLITHHGQIRSIHFSRRCFFFTSSCKDTAHQAACSLLLFTHSETILYESGIRYEPQWRACKTFQRSSITLGSYACPCRSIPWQCNSFLVVNTAALYSRQAAGFAQYKPRVAGSSVCKVESATKIGQKAIFYHCALVVWRTNIWW